jgi:hypothetical protein
LERRERTRTNSEPYLSSASSSATTLPRNSGAAASAPQSSSRLNRRQSFAAAACAENSIDDNHGVNGVLWPQGLGYDRCGGCPHCRRDLHCLRRFLQTEELERANPRFRPAHPPTISGWARGSCFSKLQQMPWFSL